MFDKIKEKVGAVVANAVIIGAVFGIVVPEADILNVVDASIVAVTAVMSTVVGWQAKVLGDSE